MKMELPTKIIKLAEKITGVEKQKLHSQADDLIFIHKVQLWA